MPNFLPVFALNSHLIISHLTLLDNEDENISFLRFDFAFLLGQNWNVLNVTKIFLHENDDILFCLCNVFLFQETFYLFMASSCMVCRQMLIVPSFSQTDYYFFLQPHGRCHEHSVFPMSVCLTFPHLVSTQ